MGELVGMALGGWIWVALGRWVAAWAQPENRLGLAAAVAAAFIVGLGALATQYTPDPDATHRAIAGHSVSALFFLWRYNARLRREAEESEESEG